MRPPSCRLWGKGGIESRHRRPPLLQRGLPVRTLGPQFPRLWPVRAAPSPNLVAGSIKNGPAPCQSARNPLFLSPARHPKPRRAINPVRDSKQVADVQTIGSILLLVFSSPTKYVLQVRPAVGAALCACETMQFRGVLGGAPTNRSRVPDTQVPASMKSVASSSRQC